MKSGHQGGHSDHSAHAPSHEAAPEPLDWPSKAGAVQDVLHEMSLRLKHRRKRRLRIAAHAFLALLAAGVTWQFAIHNRAPDSPLPSTSATVLLPERQILADGSVVELKQGAKITAAFTDSRRRVILEHGEAHFQVAKEPSRPFVVDAGVVEFRAVGTAFAVSLDDGKVEMFVTEGTVAVDQVSPPSDGVPSTFAVVDAGNCVTLDMDDLQIHAVSAFELDERLAWRAPRLEFSGTPLEEALQMINRHSGDQPKVRMQRDDPSLAAIRLTGILRADNVDTLVGVLEETHRIKAEKSQDGTEIRLRRLP